MRIEAASPVHSTRHIHRRHSRKENPVYVPYLLSRLGFSQGDAKSHAHAIYRR